MIIKISFLRKKIVVWALGVTATLLFLAGLMVSFILYPGITYANKKNYGNFRIYHNSPIDTRFFFSKLDTVDLLIRKSELYDSSVVFDICTNEGLYPRVMQAILGRGFAFGFYNKVVLQGSCNYQNNYVELNGFKWNLTQLLAHEITHCLQFNKLGLWKSNPVARIPTWKWEGYAEYTARKNKEQENLTENITRFIESDSTNWAISFNDSTIVSRGYYKHWLLAQYSIDAKGLTFQQLLDDTKKESEVNSEMMEWYRVRINQ